MDFLTPTTDIYADPTATITVSYADYQYDEYVDRTQHKTGSAQVRFDYHEEAHGVLTIRDVAGGDRTAQELVRYAPGRGIKGRTFPGRIRRIEEWDQPGRRPPRASGPQPCEIRHKGFMGRGRGRGGSLALATGRTVCHHDGTGRGYLRRPGANRSSAFQLEV